MVASALMMLLASLHKDIVTMLLFSLHKDVIIILLACTCIMIGNL